MSHYRFEDQKDKSRYVLFDGDDIISSIDYSDNGTSIALTRVFTPPTHRGQGYAAIMMSAAVEEIAKAGDRTIKPVCSYAGVWFEKHPEYDNLLTKSEN